MDVCDRVICLTLGHETLPRRVSIEGGGDAHVRLPVIGVLVHGPGGWLLVDTGLSPTMRDPAAAARIYRGGSAEVPDGEPLLDALAACGLAPADLAAVAISHLHVDHTGGLRHVPPGTPVFVQRTELDFGLATAGVEHAYVREDYVDRELAWAPVDGDAGLLPGVEALSTPGHTPGHMSLRVRVADGPDWLLAMDAIDLQDGIDTDTPIGSSARPEDGVAQRRASHARLMALARDEGVRLIPGHCPRTWPAMPGPPAGTDLRTG